MDKWFFLKLVELYICWLVLVLGGALAFFKGVWDLCEVSLFCFFWFLVLFPVLISSLFFVFMSLLGGWTLDIVILHGFFFLCLFSFDWHAGLDAFYFSWYFFVFLSSLGMLFLSFLFISRLFLLLLYFPDFLVYYPVFWFFFCYFCCLVW